ncbi:DUF4185 domain-containing protein [Yimella sp. cx-51]|uniref:DUF4185 domain-containing protein n=1 Tax=Yimella sp. cx-51 TaxID=2770551 RepID=UPI00165D5744|nr:DUF4185 domain-containing protein [Yimella sp. cx-51]MBC9957960.1 DUF4185 domain-containing protein [Yimella sp. cx-51]QTH38090.1 DUF4185 domain-containing protein [Yimella sp. cx-51]
MSHERLNEAVEEIRAFRRRHWRLRLFALIGVLAVVAGLMLHQNRALDAGTDAAEGSDPNTSTTVVRADGSTLEPRCAAPKLTGGTTVAMLNQIVGDLDLPYLQAADVATSGMLSDGRIIWAFGDTVRSSAVAPRMVANSVAISSDTCVSQLLVKRPQFVQPGPVLADRADGAVYWPTSLTVLPDRDGDNLALFTSRIKRTGFGAFDFDYLGADAYLLQVPRGGVPRVVQHLQLTPDRSTPVNWGGASVVRDDWLYVFGTADAFGGSRPMYVARAPLTSLADQKTWTFWNGTEWGRDHRAATNVLSAGDGVSQTFSADVINGKFAIVSKCGGDLGDTVCSWTSAGPTGPWQRSRQVRVPFRDGAALQYAPLAHPELKLRDGKLAVSYSRNTDNLVTLTNNPRLGRPAFVEVDWPVAR